MESAGVRGGKIETYITLLQVRFIDDGLRNTRVFEHVLAEVRVHFEDGVGGFGGFGGSVVGAAAVVGGAIALLLLGFRHDEGAKGGDAARTALFNEKFRVRRWGAYALDK